MSMEILKIFEIVTEPEELSKKEALEIYNPLYVNYSLVNSRGALYIMKEKGIEEYRYTSSFFESAEPLQILYYFHSDTFSMGIAFFHYIKYR